MQNEQMLNSGRCFIYGALTANYMPERPVLGDLVIAADKGYDRLKELGIKPDILVGDFDSLGKKPDFENTVELQVRKDDTDIGHAVELAMGKGYRDFVIYGGVGERLDHTLANIAISESIVLRGGKVICYGDEYSLIVIHNAGCRFPKREKGRISVFSLSDVSHGVSITGLSYTVEGIDLRRENPLGVSNEFIGSSAMVSVGDGTLLITYESIDIEKP